MISRRDLLKQIGIAGTVAAAPVAAPRAAAAQQQNAAASTRAREAFATLTAAESDVLEAITARLIPSDAAGPGASEARAAHYIDRALAGPLSASRGAYTSGLAALDDYARSTKGSPFARLSAADQDAVLGDIEANRALGFTPNGATFFNMVRAHTIEGTFSDPYYGGNANFVGWDLIGYPGVRVSVAPAEQQLNVVIRPNHKSAYDFDMFSKQK
jgi:gluconate 2-dehydrogenase gamma chain